MQEEPKRPQTQEALTESRREGKESKMDLREYVKQMGNKRSEPEEVKMEMVNERRATEWEDDCRSQCSSRSNRSSLNGSEWRFTGVKKVRSIEELESKMESLLEKGLKLLKRQKSSMGLGRWG